MYVDITYIHRHISYIRTYTLHFVLGYTMYLNKTINLMFFARNQNNIHDWVVIHKI